VLDIYRTPKHPETVAWLARHRRFHLHVTPSSPSSINQVETWFSILHRKPIRAGVCRSVGSLNDVVHRFRDAGNDTKHKLV